MNTPCIIFSTTAYIEKYVREKGLPPTRENKQRLGGDLLASNPHAIINALWAQIDRCSIDGLVPIIDSVRSIDQHNEWSNRIRNYRTVFIDTDYETRFDRYNLRENEEGRTSISRAKFAEFHQASTDNQHEAMREIIMPGFEINNQGPIETFREKILGIQQQYIHLLS